MAHKCFCCKSDENTAKVSKIQRGIPALISASEVRGDDLGESLPKKYEEGRSIWAHETCR